MVFYFAVFFILFILAIQQKKYSKRCFNIAFILLLFLGATRADTVGMDVRYYCSDFKIVTYSNMHDPNMNFEPGFYTMMCLFKDYISKNAMLFIHCIFIIYMLCIAFFLKRYTVKPALALFFIYGLTYYIFAFNGMRQSMCFGILLLILPLLIEKRKIIIYSLLVITISLLFHKSQIILLLFLLPVLFQNSNIFKTKFLICSIVISFIIGAFLTSNVFAKLGFLSKFITDARYNDYIINDEDLNKVSYFSNCIHNVALIVLIILSRKKRDIFIIISTIGMIILNVLSPISWIFGRLADSLLFFRVVPMTRLWYEIENVQTKYYYRIFIFSYVLFRFWGRLLRDAATGINDVIPYINSLLNIKF